MQYLRITIAVLAVWFASDRADAALLVEIHQSGSDVVVSGSGTVDLTGLEFLTLYTSDAFMYPSQGELGIAGGDSDLYFYTPSAGAEAYGPGGLIEVNSYSGDPFGFDGIEGGVIVPRNYVSGDPLSGTSTYAGQTFASLGLTPGTYIYELPNDSITLQISESAGVPEPTSLALLGLTSLGFVITTRRKQSPGV